MRADGSGHVRWDDTEVVAGRSYAYRLVEEADGARQVLGEMRALSAGLYFVNLEQSGRRVTTRLVRTE